MQIQAQHKTHFVKHNAEERILVTGMSGLIGSKSGNDCKTSMNITALNRHKIEGVKCYRADISNLDDIIPAFEGIDTVVHLAAVWRDSPTWDEYQATDVTGTCNVFEASRRKGVRRVIFASSGATVPGVDAEPVQMDLSRIVHIRATSSKT